MRTLLMSAMVFPAASIAQTLQAPDLQVGGQGYTFTYGVSNQQPTAPTGGLGLDQCILPAGRGA